MIAIISSIIVVITVLISVLVSFTPNVRAVLQTDFMRNATNNAYIYGWERAQIKKRAGGLPLAIDNGNPAATALPNVVVGKKGGVTKEQLAVTVRYHLHSGLGNKRHLDITVMD